MASRCDCRSSSYHSIDCSVHIVGWLVGDGGVEIERKRRS